MQQLVKVIFQGQGRSFRWIKAFCSGNSIYEATTIALPSYSITVEANFLASHSVTAQARKCSTMLQYGVVTRTIEGASTLYHQYSTRDPEFLDIINNRNYV